MYERDFEILNSFIITTLLFGYTKKKCECLLLFLKRELKDCLGLFRFRIKTANLLLHNPIIHT